MPFTVPDDGFISIYVEPHGSDNYGYYHISGILKGTQQLRINAQNGMANSNTCPVKKGDNLNMLVASGLKTIMITYVPFTTNS